MFCTGFVEYTSRNISSAVIRIQIQTENAKTVRPTLLCHHLPAAWQAQSSTACRLCPPMAEARPLLLYPCASRSLAPPGVCLLPGFLQVVTLAPSAPPPPGCLARQPAARHGCRKLQHLLSMDRSSSALPTSPSRRPPPHRPAASQPQLYPGSSSTRSSGDLYPVRGMVVTFREVQGRRSPFSGWRVGPRQGKGVSNSRFRNIF
jgi:hypothetical protein